MLFKLLSVGLVRADFGTLVPRHVVLAKFKQMLKM